MKKVIKLCAMGLIIVIVGSCGNQKNSTKLADAENKIFQQEDGSISLQLEKAACYSDEANPSSNTAEWNIVVTKPGRYRVWLASATKDTTDLSYANSVRISFLDNRIEGNPEIDKVVRNSSEVDYPFFRTDSDMGTFFIPEPGEYTIQIISEKVISKESRAVDISLSDNTRLMSLFLDPMTR